MRFGMDIQQSFNSGDDLDILVDVQFLIVELDLLSSVLWQEDVVSDLNAEWNYLSIAIEASRSSLDNHSVVD